jgi:hypothetical protein
VAVLLPALAGITVEGRTRAVVTGNTVALIGSAATVPSNAIGIGLGLVQSALISGNDISDIGMPSQLDLPARGIAVAEFADLTVAGNIIRQTGVAPSQAESFTGITIFGRQTAGISVSVENNSITGNTPLPLIDIVNGGNCVVTGNRCTQAPDSIGTNLPVVVQISGHTAIASNNRIACNQSYRPLSIQVDSTGSGDSIVYWATVVGNIVGGEPIFLNAQPLPMPWRPLNLVAPD